MTNPPAAAVANGHKLESDPPMMSAALRWTCTSCGHAALNYKGNEYGSAMKEKCLDAPEEAPA